jgi:DNA polymerase III, gamma/tau subunits
LQEEEAILWVEKYRPKSLNDLVNQEDIVKRLRRFVEERNIPHMLFYGPPGTGKTTSALALARDLYGENYKQYFLELNASDERGIDVIRTKVKEFARTLVPTETGFKIILLDEADNMTTDAQQALRRMMEMYGKATRFILLCNYLSKIIDPIQSRTALFRFTPLKREDIIKRLKFICEKEGVNCTKDGLELIYDVSSGDLRKAINYLQASSTLGDVNSENVMKVTSFSRPEEVRKILEYSMKGDFESARNYLRVLLIEKGMTGEDIVRALHREIMNPQLKISEKTRVMLADSIGETEFRIVEGADDEIQLASLIAKFILMFKEGE